MPTITLMNELTKQPDQALTDKPPKRLNPKQKKTIEYWFDPNSETYGNLTRSAIKAGFRPKYALNLASNKPLWLYETVESTLKLEKDHIINGVQQIATNPNVDSRSPADTNLKAFELLGNWAGLSTHTQQTNVTLVQPILAGASYTPRTDVIDQSPEPEKSPEK